VRVVVPNRKPDNFPEIWRGSLRPGGARLWSEVSEPGCPHRNLASLAGGAGPPHPSASTWPADDSTQPVGEPITDACGARCVMTKVNPPAS
jgi:hypothetical protein